MEKVLKDADDNLYKVKKLLDESHEIVDRIKALKAERSTAKATLWLTSP